MKKIEIKYISLNLLKPYKNNPRINDDSVEAVAKSIKKFGFKVPLVIDKDFNIVCGHTRYKASQKLGLEEVPCIIADDLTPSQLKAFRLADNKVGENSTWDFTKLEQELSEIGDIDMSEFGFDLDFDDDEEEKEIVEDEVPNVPEEPKSKLGDIYQLGNHRLMCGDSTDEEQVKELVGGEHIELLMTDPPYNMKFNGAGFVNKINNNVKARIKNMIDFDPEKIRYLANSNIGSMYIFTSKDLIKKYLEIFDNWKFNLLIWEKTNTPPMVNNNFFADIEYLLYFHKGKRIWNNKLKPIDIYKKFYISPFGQGKKDAGTDLHPTMKPIKLLSDKIRISSSENGIVLDLFGGSGSTLIACEQLNRKCYMMELDPHYIDVIIQRWENFTGKKAIKTKGDYINSRKEK